MDLSVGMLGENTSSVRVERVKRLRKGAKEGGWNVDGGEPSSMATGVGSFGAGKYTKGF